MPRKHAVCHNSGTSNSFSLTFHYRKFHRCLRVRPFEKF
jgi:hypothetical protein